MSDKNYELELYKIITEEDTYVAEFGWVSESQLCIWISYYNLYDFIDRIKSVFGYGVFDYGGFDANMQSDGICIDLCKMLGDYLDIESVFPKEKYQH